MAVVFSNNAKTTLASSASTSATSISVADGSVFPALSGSDYAYVTFEDTSGNVEIVKVTALSSNTLTVVRAQDNTSARAFSAGDKCELRVTAGGLNEVAAAGGLTWIYAATMPTTAVPNSGYLAAGGQSTLMPLNPAVGTVVAFSDLNDEFDTNPLTLNGNGQTFFQGTDVQYILDLKGTFAEFSFLNGYWRLINFGRLSDAYGFGAGGSSETQAKIRLTSTTDASTTSTGHAFQIGPDSGGTKIKMDSNEIGAYNGTSTAALRLNNDGGNVYMGSYGHASSLSVTGNITAGSNITANHIFVGSTTGSYIALQPTNTGAAGVKIRTGSGDFSIDLMPTINDFHIREDTTIRYTFLKNGNFTATGTVNGRDIATDGTKLDGIEASADVTDSTNVVAALTAGTNITIAADGTISSSGGGGGGAFTGGTISGSDVTLATGIELITQTAGSNNFRAGVDAGSSITSSGGSNTFVGDESGKANTSGDRGSAFGYRALKSNTTGNNNSAFGAEAMQSNLTGFANVAGGVQALAFNNMGANNVAIGYRALYSNVSGNGNSSFGYESLKANTTGGDNVALGYSTLKFNTTGLGNVAIGGSVLSSNTTGNYNTAVGKSALNSNTTAGYGTAFGYYALGSNTSGAFNTAFGINVLKENTTGQNNSASGSQSMVANTTGRFNSAFGAQTLNSNTTSDSNSAFGYQALKNNTTGTENSAAGREALLYNLTGSGNVAHGFRSLRSSTGSNNTATGHQSGYSLTTGALNTFSGKSSGYYITTGNKNSILGSFDGNEGGLDIRTSSNNIVLSDGDGNPRLHINSSGAATFASTVNGVDIAARDAVLTSTTTTAGAALPKAGGTLTGDVTFAAGADLITTTAGTSNLRLGVDAGTNLASGSTGNTFVGDNAGKDTTTGDNNVAVGKGALENNIASSSNVAVGMEALFSNITGQSNSAIGFRTLYANTTGSNNMGIGQASLRFSTTGNNNLAIGVQSVFANTTGSSNVGLGLHALYTNANGNFNTASGTQALKFTTAADNTAMGGQAGMAVTSGTLNSFFGKASGSLVTTGSKNTILGAFDGNENGLDIRTSSNNIVLADGDGNPRLHIDGSGAATFSGNVDVGGALDVTGTTTGTGGFNVPNNVPFRGTTTGGGTARMLRMSSSNVIEVGATSQAMDIFASTATVSGNLTSTGSTIKIDTASTASLVLDSGTGNSARQYFGNNGTYYATIAAHPTGDPSGTGHNIALCAGSGGGDVRFGGMNVGENLVEIGGIFKNTALNVRGNATFNQTLDVDGTLTQETFSSTGATRGIRIGDGYVAASTTVTSLAWMMRFHNPNGNVGTISTSGTATSYTTSSDPRLKSEFTPITGASAMILEARDQGLIGEFHFLSEPTQTVWGYNAHKVADLQVGFGGSEGEGPRDLGIGAVYEEAVMGERPVMVAELDEEGEPTGEMIESGELEAYEVSPEKTVSPAGIDQSKRVPILEAAIGELLDRIAVIEASNEALLDRITALENA